MYKDGAHNATHQNKEALLAREDAHFRLRIPDDVRAWVQKTAEENRRSMTGQIIFILEKEMKNEKSGTTA
jgi:hypothetical protein